MPNIPPAPWEEYFLRPKKVEVQRIVQRESISTMAGTIVLTPGMRRVRWSDSDGLEHDWFVSDTLFQKLYRKPNAEHGGK